ncbi:long-chain fatty acid CoA ligase, putative [Eimeria necatrix]|uniref:Long-chain fatty acid CoA ligase, putative n=1 Tax=Eimeria necatrix TaxID=51315 RepID=U6MXC5_9EIME|nr:long-chain fatty acid CoA ligase, putative [Eimeria necatrix]CDJ66365.1 long-chain fatty acid CoA ligase, putative [Eimeria necatrix]
MGLWSVSVPRLFQRIEARVTSSLQGKSFVARSLFNQALAAKIRRLRSSGIPQHPFWDKVVFDKFKNLMGGRVRIMLTGSAPLDPHTLERMRAFFCCWIVEGYGMTETMGASFLTWNVYDNNPGQIGGVLPSLEFCLLDVSETMNKYSIKDEIPKGELCVRGSTVSAGYFRNAQETRAAIDQDGWLHTGDIAALLPNGGVQIIDRKKNIFKLAQGEYVAPEKVETVYMQSRFVAQCFVFGFSSETSLVAIVVPDQEQTLRWLQEVRGADVADSRPFEEWVKDPAVQKAVYDDMQQVGKVQGLKGFELARKIHLHSEQFTVENGLLTPTFKLKRHYAQEVSDFHVREVGDIDTTTGICRGICGTASKRLVSDLRLLGNMKAENTAQKWLTVLLDVWRPPQEPSAGVFCEEIRTMYDEIHKEQGA